ncbi:hypothetical protein GNF18_01650 [Ligilactobacillus pobuzihii]|uniref:CidA/LrgA family protein n=1 Tax=Ligilactobacillus pobuzihii TaxID=449659 RepID=UPI0019D2FF84|nr:CidA/LrgA family protein [Ligilactobacillus pobuzihii]MBN7273878.1 hypothetical protein [Ligilactobacillus pobuzihii]
MGKDAGTKKSAPIMVQMLIYAAILFVSQILSNLLPKSFPIPTPVIGLILLYLLLTVGVIKLEWVDSLSTALVGTIGFLFVPSGISLAGNLGIMKDEGIQLIIVIILSTVIMLVSIAYTAKLILWIKNKFTGGQKESTDATTSHSQQMNHSH